MLQPTQEELESALVDIISDGLNRSLGALSEAGAIDTSRLSKHYQGLGSKYYDLVSAQIEATAKNGALSIGQLYARSKSGAPDGDGR